MEFINPNLKPVQIPPVGWQPQTGDFTRESQARANEIRSRYKDIRAWGILRKNSYDASVNIPVSGVNPSPNLPWSILQAPLTLDVAHGLLSIGKGSTQSLNPPVLGLVAYDLNGERIAITQDQTFTFTPQDVQGRPQSSGNLSIPLTLHGTSGDYTQNPSIPGLYYLWIEYINLIDPTFTSVATNGQPFNSLQTDGYRILMTGIPVAPPNGNGISVYLGQVNWVGGSGLLTLDDSVTPGQYVTDGVNYLASRYINPGDAARVYLGIRDMDVEVVLGSAAAKTVNYARGLLMSLHDHINATGSGTPGANNPHGLGFPDLGAGVIEPIATQNQASSLAGGIIDLNVPQNSPVWASNALKPTINLTTLIPAANLDFVASKYGVSSSVQSQWVRLGALNSQGLLMCAYIQGNFRQLLYPTLRQTTNFSADSSIIAGDPTSGDGWIGFADGVDNANSYYILASMDSLSDGTPVLVLSKAVVSGAFNLKANQMILGEVYWDGTNLWRNPTEPNTPSGSALNNQPDDFRVLGLVGPKQLSRAAKADPNAGALSQVVRENLLANANYLMSSGSPLYLLTGVTPVGLSNLYVMSSAIQLLYSQDNTLASGGPGAAFGMNITTRSGSLLSASHVYQTIANLKPGRNYAISFWYKALGGFNSRVEIGIDGKGDGTGDSLITQDGINAMAPLDLTVVADGNWHRASMIVQTMPTVMPWGTQSGDSVGTPRFFLDFKLEEGTLGSTAASNLYITNAQVMEGEWVEGFTPGREYPSGGNVFFDDRSVCPPGFVENTSMRGRLPIGWVPTGTGNFNVPGSFLGKPTPNTNGSAVGAHLHSISDNGGGVIQTSGTRIPHTDTNYGTDDGHPGTGGQSILLSYEVGIWCKAL